MNQPIQHPQHRGSPAKGPLSVSAQHRPFILIVDDDQFIGDLLIELLGEVGFRVEVAYDGNEAYERACAEQPELILTDYMMPECDGAVLARRLRQNPRTSDVSLALMSSARLRLDELGSIPFLPKPFDIDEVLAFVEHYARSNHYPHGEG